MTIYDLELIYETEESDERFYEYLEDVWVELEECGYWD